MKVTMQMLDAAMRKAVEAGLLPRGALREDSFGDRELIRHVLEAALNAAAAEHPSGASRTFPSWRRLARFSFPAVSANTMLAPHAKRG